MQPNIIEQALAYVKAKFENEYSGHDYFHTLRVFKTATAIAKEEGANLKIVQLASLLHDVDDVKLSPETNENLLNARRFLESHSIDTDTISTICRIIRDVSFAGCDSVVPETLEGQCVQDADRLDAIGAIGIARAFAYGGNHNRLMHHPDEKPRLNMTKDEYRSHKSTTINHFYEKLLLLPALMNTSAAHKIAAHREAFMQNYLAEFMNEWDGLL